MSKLYGNRSWNEYTNFCYDIEKNFYGKKLLNVSRNRHNEILLWFEGSKEILAIAPMMMEIRERNYPEE